MEGIRFTAPVVGRDGVTADGPTLVKDEAGKRLPTTAALSTTDATTLASIVTNTDRAADALELAATSIPHFALDAASDLSYVFSTGSASGERAALVSATAAQTTRVHRMVITAAAATVIELRDGAAGTALWTVEFPAAGAYTFDFDPRPWAKTTANTALIMNSTVATKVTIALWYVKAA